jgi:hypothetical protein
MVIEKKINPIFNLTHRKFEKSEGIWQSVRRARTEFFLRNSFLCPEQILKLRDKLIHGFKPTSLLLYFTLLFCPKTKM